MTMSIKDLWMAGFLVETRPNGQPKVIWIKLLPVCPMAMLVQTLTADTIVPGPGSL